MQRPVREGDGGGAREENDARAVPIPTTTARDCSKRAHNRAAYTAHTYLDKCAGQRKCLIVRMRERPSDQRRDTWCRVRQARQQQPCTLAACAVDMMKSTCAWNKECHRQKHTGRRDTLGGRGHLAGAATSCSHATFGCDQCNLSHPAAIQKKHRTHTQPRPRHTMPSISSKGAGT
jgi:hypothetical protein